MTDIKKFTRTRTPFPHQLEGMEYLVRNNGGFLFMEQRTGKTLTALLATLNMDKDPVLIITKASVIPVWEQELSILGIGDEDITPVRGTKAQREKLLSENSRFTVVNYEMLQRYKVLDSKTWDCVIFDESSAVANGTAKVTRYCLRAIKRLKGKWGTCIMMLSGSPAPETPMQYASQYLIQRNHFCAYNNLSTYIWECWRYNDNTGKYEHRNPMHLVLIKKLIRSTAYIRTMKDLDMGSKILYSRRFVPMNKEQRNAMCWAIAKKKALGSIGDKAYIGYLNMIAAGVDPFTGEIISTEKINSIIEYLKENREPVLILGFFREPLNKASALLRQAGFKASTITGNTAPHYREIIRDDFQAGKLDVIVGQVDAVKMGLDFSRASLTFYISNSFSNDSRDQSEMRTTNINKKEAVWVVDVCCRDSLDEIVVNSLVKKEIISDAFLSQESYKLEKKYEQSDKQDL